MLDVLIDAGIDSLKIFPFLFAAYILIEVMESRISQQKTVRLLRSRFAPLFGASFGLLPQCGFSVVATDLYAKRYLTLGTLLAVYIATSDEAIPVILGYPDKIWVLLPILGIKFLVACGVGYLADFVFRKRETTELPNEIWQHEEEEDVTFFVRYLARPFLHALKIFVYVFLINFLLGAIIYFVGEESLNEFLRSGFYFQPLFASLVGLIPNCASSVLITQLYLNGGIGFGACLSGLVVNSGVAFSVLFKQNRNWKENFAIVGGLFFLSVALGYLLIGLPF